MVRGGQRIVGFRFAHRSTDFPRIRCRRQVYVRIDQPGQYVGVGQIHDSCGSVVDKSFHDIGDPAVLDNNAVSLYGRFAGLRQQPSGMHDRNVTGVSCLHQ